MTTPTQHRPGRLLVAALLAAALTACGAVPMNTATIEQVTQQLQSYFQAAHAEITTSVPDATLEPRREPLVGQCGPPHGTAPRGQEFVGYSNLLRGFPTDRNPDIYAAVERFWAANGWTIYEDGRATKRGLYARSPDKYEMVVRISGDGTDLLSLAGNSPCVWPDGTPSE